MAKAGVELARARVTAPATASRAEVVRDTVGSPVDVVEPQRADDNGDGQFPLSASVPAQHAGVRLRPPRPVLTRGRTSAHRRPALSAYLNAAEIWVDSIGRENIGKS